MSLTEVLSEAEVSALLDDALDVSDTLSTSPDGQVVDFRSVLRTTVERPLLERVQHHVTNDAAARLSRRFGQRVQLTMVDVKRVSRTTFTNDYQLNASTGTQVGCAVRLSALDFARTALWLLDTSLVTQLVDVALGGAGSGRADAGSHSVERAFTRTWLADVHAALIANWSAVAPAIVQEELSALRTLSSHECATGDNDLVVTRWRLEVGTVSGNVAFAISEEQLDAIAFAFRSEIVSTEHLGLATASQFKVPVRASVNLGECALNDMRSWRVGTVLPVGLVTLRGERHVLARGRLASADGALAFECLGEARR